MELNRDTTRPAKRLPLYKKEWEKLTARKKRTRKQALHALSLMKRDVESLGSAAKIVGIHPETVLRHVGPAIYKNRNEQYVARDKDMISRSMRIKENGNDVFITIRGSRVASLISDYHNAVRQYLETGDDLALQKFSGIKIKDSKRVRHKLETNKEKLKESEEKKEDRETMEIYDD